MLLIRYGLGVLGVALAVLAVSHPGAADCGTGCGSVAMLGAVAGDEVGELLPSLVALLGLADEWPPWAGTGLRAAAAR